MLPDTATNTDKLIDYHLGKINHQPTIGRVIAVQSGLMLCALVGLLYAVPASDYSADSPEERALNIAGSCYMSVLICYVGADMFFRMHLEKQWPDSELEGIVAAPLTPADFKRQNYIIGICALASGIPFSTTAITYPPEGISLGWTIAYVGYVLVAEAVLHFLPVKLTLDHPFYGTLPRWGLELWNYLRQQQKTEDEFQLIESAKDLKSRREELGKRIKNVSDHLLASFIPSLGQLDKNKLNVFLNQSSQEQFEHLLSIEQSAEQNFPTWAMNTARFLGAVTVLGSCLGYAANPFLLFTNWTGSWWKALLCVAFPLYFFGVLIAYFGDEYGKKILTDLALLSENMGTLLQGKALKLPLICRLYPISMTCFVLVNISLLIYSPAAAEQMMGLAFKPVASSTVIMMLTILAKAGTFILAWYAPLDFQQLMLKYGTQYMGIGDTQKLILLAARLQTLAEDMLQLSETNVADIEQRIQQRTHSKTEDILPNVKQNRIWCCFKLSKSGDEESQSRGDLKVNLLMTGHSKV